MSRTARTGTVSRSGRHKITRIIELIARGIYRPPTVCTKRRGT
jgi:hypothetical protein